MLIMRLRTYVVNKEKSRLEHRKAVLKTTSLCRAAATVYKKHGAWRWSGASRPTHPSGTTSCPCWCTTPPACNSSIDRATSTGAVCQVPERNAQNPTGGRVRH